MKLLAAIPRKLYKSYTVLVVFLLFSFSACYHSYQMTDVKATYNRIDKKITDTDAEMDSMILPYKKKLDKKMSAVIGYCSDGLSIGKPESNLGNWVADLLVQKAEELLAVRVDFGIQNYGGLRVSQIPEGEITIGKIYELMPFDNFLVILRIEGKELGVFFDRLASYGGWPVSRELRLVFESGSVKTVTIGGKPVDAKKTYKIALPDYIANGGDNCWFFKDKEQLNTGVLIRDAIITHIEAKTEKGEKISAITDGRITTVN